MVTATMNGWVSMTTRYVDALFKHLRARSESVAFALGDDRLTWAELDDASRRYAMGLLRLGLRKGDRVAVALETSLDLVISLVGHYRLGLIHVPVNTQYRAAELGHILRDSGARALVTHAGCPIDEVSRGVELPTSLEHRIVAGEPDASRVSFEKLRASEPQAGSPAALDHDLALFIYTSGTTGASKGVMHSFASVVSNIEALTDLWRWSDADRQILALPLFHVHGLGIGVHGALLQGCATELHRGFEARAVIDAVGRGATIFMGVPTMHSRLLKAMQADPAAAQKMARARLFTSGSAALPAHVFDGYERLTGLRILERYGMSETMLTLSNPYDGERRRGTVGLPVPGCEIRVVDEDFNDSEAGALGQIIMRGDSLMQGYWGQPERSAKALRDGWFLTGDIARRAPDGYISIVGRKSVDILKSGGYKISAREIEECLIQHPWVAEIGVVGLYDEEWGQRIAAGVVLEAEYSDATNASVLSALQRFSDEALAAYKKVREVLIIDGLPRNALGKVQKHRLVEAFDHRE